MSRPAITVNGLSKSYQIGHEKMRRRPNFQETLTAAAKVPLRWFGGDDVGGPSVETFWALKDVSFNVEHGEIVGIVGRNGAGKSTLLKILSRITEPTEGEVRFRGRVASLLEVGTGFHPELTGRENIYLNGSILGMRKFEIDRKFDEIVAFAEVERFLDTPVKRYSSGMYVRLAFAVAAHLEPEILIVDEVLAVGDMEFQQKCLGKMGEVARGGRTILFVSHNMAAIQNLCQTGLMMAGGRLMASGPCGRVIETYLQSGQTGNRSRPALESFRAVGMKSVIRDVTLSDPTGRPVSIVLGGAPLTIAIRYESPEPLADPQFGIVVETIAGERLFSLQSMAQYGTIRALPARGVIRCTIPAVPLLRGGYFLTLNCSVGGIMMDLLERAVELAVVDADFFGTGRLPPPKFGRCLVHASWDLPEGTGETAVNPGIAAAS